ncbi:hypothetical protein [Aquamicrobium sp.]|uniref:hypothetical protein n=1 Tax=Aquamicrobium sp. TaxID=1872579 RepID=UPI00258F98B9|nr:hypothetical protein [Aquamicrobium sp.]MCK9549146.1 hypothetical protein [Aquamicrobium sp.]
MRLVHHSDHYLTEIRDAGQDRDRDGMRGDCAMKPFGLWVSVEGDDDWPSWCRAEQFQLGKLTHPTEVVLRDNANVLRLRDESEIRNFHQEYGCRPHFADKMGDSGLFDGNAVRWAAVAERYSGIIIAPYVWSLRLDQTVRWYYPWDCASGCIWSSRAVAELVPLPTLQHSVDRTDASTDSTGA